MSVTEGEVIRHCERCDRESKHLINSLSPHNVPELVCWECVEQEDQRSRRISAAGGSVRRGHGNGALSVGFINENEKGGRKKMTSTVAT